MEKTYKPDFTKDNPYSDASQEYIEKIKGTDAYSKAVAAGWINVPEAQQKNSALVEPPPAIPDPEIPETAKPFQYKADKTPFSYKDEKTGEIYYAPGSTPYEMGHRKESERQASHGGTGYGVYSGSLIPEDTIITLDKQGQPYERYVLSQIGTEGEGGAAYEALTDVFSSDNYVVAVKTPGGEKYLTPAQAADISLAESDAERLTLYKEYGIVPETVTLEQFTADPEDLKKEIAANEFEYRMALKRNKRAQEQYEKELAQFEKDLQQDFPEGYRVYKDKGYDAYVDFANNKRRVYEQHVLATSMLEGYTDEEGLVDGAAYLRDFNDTRTLANAGFSAETIGEWVKYNEENLFVNYQDRVKEVRAKLLKEMKPMTLEDPATFYNRVDGTARAKVLEEYSEPQKKRIMNSELVDIAGYVVPYVHTGANWAKMTTPEKVLSVATETAAVLAMIYGGRIAGKVAQSLKTVKQSVAMARKAGTAAQKLDQALNEFKSLEKLAQEAGKTTKNLGKATGKLQDAIFDPRMKEASPPRKVESLVKLLPAEETPVKKGYTRLYRGEEIIEMGAKSPAGQENLRGMWFTTNKDVAIRYAQLGKARVLKYIDLPTTSLKKYKTDTGNLIGGEKWLEGTHLIPKDAQVVGGNKAGVGRSVKRIAKLTNELETAQRASLKADRRFLERLERIDAINPKELSNLERLSGIKGLRDSITDVSQARKDLLRAWEQAERLAKTAKTQIHPESGKDIFGSYDTLEYRHAMDEVKRAQIALEEALLRADSVLQVRFKYPPGAPEFKGYSVKIKKAQLDLKGIQDEIDLWLAKNKPDVEAHTGKPQVIERTKIKPKVEVKIKAKYKMPEAKPVEPVKMPEAVAKRAGIKPSVFPGIVEKAAQTKKKAGYEPRRGGESRVWTEKQREDAYRELSEITTGYRAKYLVDELDRLARAGQVDFSRKEWVQIKEALKAAVAVETKIKTSKLTDEQLKENIREVVKDVIADKPDLMTRLEVTAVTKLITKTIVEAPPRKPPGKTPPPRPPKKTTGKGIPVRPALSDKATDKEKRKFIETADNAVGWVQGQLHGKPVNHIVTYHGQAVTHISLLGDVPENVDMKSDVKTAYESLRQLKGRPPRKPIELEGGAVDPVLFEKDGKTRISFVPDVKRGRRGSRGDKTYNPRTREIAPGIVEQGSGSKRVRRVRMV
jgi:hypothetical protein